MKDEQRLGLLKETLTVIFGLEENTVHRAVRIIKSSQDSSDIRTPNIRSRIGPRAMQYLRNAIEIARHEGTEKHENEKSMDMSKKSDISPSSRNKSQKSKNSKKSKQKNESFSFTDFLLNEVAIDVNLDDAQGSMQELRRAQRLNKTSPERLNRENTIKAKQEQRDAQQSSGDDPSANLRAKIAKKKVELGTLNSRLNSMNKASKTQNDSTEGTV